MMGSLISRSVLLLALLTPGWAFAAVQPDPAAPSQPTAEEIVARNVAARGGLDAWRGVHAMLWAGRVENGGGPTSSARFVLEQARPNRTRFGVSVTGEESLRVFDGQRGWKMRPKQGIRPDVQPFSAEEIRFAKDAEVIDGPLIDYAAHGNRISLGGLEDVEGKKAWRIDVLRGSGASETVWIDADTFLDLRYERTSYKPKGDEVKISIHYHDFRKFDGVQIPTVLDLGGGGSAASSRMVIEQVLINPELDEFAFAEPGKPHLLSKPRPESGRGPTNGSGAFDRSPPASPQDPVAPAVSAQGPAAAQ